MRSIAELEKRIQCLERENQYLKNFLTDAGISYSVKIIDDNGNEYDPNQGARIMPRDITETDAKMFFRACLKNAFCKFCPNLRPVFVQIQEA